MTTDPGRFGADLRLLPALEVTRSDRDGGEDLKLRPSAGGADLAVLTGSDCLAQALVLRLLTPLGALERFGHPGYGCRLAELIGELNTAETRARAKVFALQSLAADPRVTRVLALDVGTAAGDRTTIRITAQLQAGDSVLNLVVPFTLAGGAA
jgi:phage baseplate assembly protein W